MVGFAAETTDLLIHAREKLQKKQLNMIVANHVGPGRGFDVDANEVMVITSNAEHALSYKHKVRLAGELIAIIAESLQNAEQTLIQRAKWTD